MITEELQKYLYEKVLVGSDDDCIKNFDSLPEDTTKQQIRKEYCNWLLFVLTDNYVKVDINKTDYSDNAVISLIDNCKKIGEEEPFYMAYAFFLEKKFDQCRKYIHLIFETIDFSNEPFVELDLAYTFLSPFKNAFDGFWTFLAEELKSVNTAPGIIELCGIIDLYYNSKSNDEVIEILLKYIQHYPESQIVNELLAYTYLSMNMWSNAIAYFERIDIGTFFVRGEILFLTAWCHGKTKNHVEEERCYRESNAWLCEHGLGREFLLNNLGYSLYQQKKYNEAIEIFEDCIKQKVDLQFVPNNYVRTLIAIGRFEDAKHFIENSEFKISKNLKDKVEKCLKKKPTKKAEPIILDSEDDAIAKVQVKDIGVKREQFTNEKLLEDELTARIESGISVFGLDLKIYKRRGEYGR